IVFHRQPLYCALLEIRHVGNALAGALLDDHLFLLSLYRGGEAGRSGRLRHWLYASNFNQNSCRFYGAAVFFIFATDRKSTLAVASRGSGGAGAHRAAGRAVYAIFLQSAKRTFHARSDPRHFRKRLRLRRARLALLSLLAARANGMG